MHPPYPAVQLRVKRRKSVVAICERLSSFILRGFVRTVFQCQCQTPSRCRFRPRPTQEAAAAPGLVHRPSRLARFAKLVELLELTAEDVALRHKILLEPQ